jgi:heme exporter protein C
MVAAMKTSIFELANPKRFMDASGAVLPWLSALAAILIAAGLYLGLFVAPRDYQQGDTVRIMYVHVPAAWNAMMAYALMAGASLFGLVNRHPLADVAARTAAPLGALFTALALITGSLWGKPMWGTYWVWDARLTSFLILLFVYLGYIALWNAIEDEARAARAAAILALVGAVNLPIIHFSVAWWNTLHQGESIFRSGGPTISAVFLWPLFLMAAGYTALFATLWILRIRTEILNRRARALMLQTGEGQQ